MSDNILILLSNEFDDNLNLNSVCKTRADYMYSLYNEGDIIFTLGWKGLVSNKNISDEMKKHIIEKYKVPQNSIISINESRDTVGDAVFSRFYIDKLKNKKNKNIKVVTSDWHLHRVKYIFNTIFPETNIEFHGVYTEGGDEIKEKKSLEIYKKTFKDIDFHNFNEIKQRLLSKHLLYKDFSF